MGEDAGRRRACRRHAAAWPALAGTILALLAGLVGAAGTEDTDDLRANAEGIRTLARFVDPTQVTMQGRGRIRAYAPSGWQRDAQRAWRAAERALPAVASTVGVEPGSILPIWIVIATSERAYTREAPSWSAAIAQPERHLIVLAGPVLRRSAMDAEETVVHELVHLALDARLGEQGWMPRWLNEGIAMHFSGYSRIADPLAASPRAEVHLRELTDRFPQHPALARAAYLESAAAVEALLERGPLSPLLDRLAAGDEFDEAFQAVYGESWLRFADRVHGEVPGPWRWIGTLGGGALFGLFTTALVLAGAARVRWRNRRRAREWEAAERAAAAAIEAAEANSPAAPPGPSPP